MIIKTKITYVDLNLIVCARQTIFSLIKAFKVI